jgi:hypothetical protein
MISFGDWVLIGIPLIGYWYTSIPLMFLPLPVAIAYSIFGALKRHHLNQPLVEPEKIRLYSSLHMKFKFGLLISYWSLEFIALYLSEI